jgi:hypothetical protein
MFVFVNIKEIPGKEHEERRLQFKVKINDGVGFVAINVQQPLMDGTIH